MCIRDRDYVAIVIDNNRDFNRINNTKGFFINGIKFKRLLGTPSGIKKRTIFYAVSYTHLDVYKRQDSEGTYEILSAINVKSLNRELLMYCRQVRN